MIELDFCITAMQHSISLGRRAFINEVAIGLYVYYAHESSSLPAKRALREIYASAGELDCAEPGGASYKTVSRRVNRIAALYNHIGQAQMSLQVGPKHEKNALEAIIEALKPLELTTMDSVGEYAGIERKRIAGPAKTRRISDKPDTDHIITKHLRIDVPKAVERSEILEAIAALKRLLKSHN